ncbi:ABC transporter ATP-binding protein [uncultured Paraglaciecola sp.]|uniref:ABC transporter ATP-binding protein n=1 Tax=uncultured Paraglaciecola sp. TaxID=1765024 RepID=UPI0030DCF2CC
MSAFIITDLEYRYAKSSVPALQGININLDTGQCLGLIGPNGSGKSTLLSILSGLLTPTSGTVQFGHNDNLTLAKFVQKNVALVPQEYAFYPKLSVAQNLQYFVSLCGFSSNESQTRVEIVLRQCQLQQVSSQKAKFLSGGYKRRLNLAIALLKDPQILYLDEPTVGVDPISRGTILALLSTLKNQGKTIVYTSHLLTEVQDICDQIVMLNQGKAGYLSLNTAQKCLTIEFAQALSLAWLKQLSSLPLKIECEDNRVTANISSPEELLTMLALLSGSQLEILNMHYDQTSLTQYYLNHMENNDTSEH